MNWRAFGALMRREIARGRRTTQGMLLIGVTAIGAVMLLSPDLAIAVGSLCIIPAVAVVFGPLGNLRTDKTQGYVEFDRVLPVSHRAMAIARLFGAAVRTLPQLLLVVPLIIALERSHTITLATMTALLLVVPAASWTIFTALLWLLMAVNIRWTLRRLWWLPMTIGFGPTIVSSLLPPPWKHAIADAVRGYFDRNGDAILAFVATPTGAISIALILVSGALAVFFGTVILFASGVERYTFDAAAAVEMRTKPPRRELAALGRGPSLAVARYCIRLATEQSWRRFLLLGVFVLVLVFGKAELKQYAQFYVRALAAMIPGGIALQLSVARARGYLEGMQQLPHPAQSIGAGYLMAIAALATPGVAVWVLARAVTGIPPTVTNVLSLWGWMVGWSWLACVSVVWLTGRRSVMLAAVPLSVAALWASYRGFTHFVADLRAAGAAFAAFRVQAGAALPLTVAVAIMVIGLPLFARGLAEFEHGAPKKAPFWRRLTTPRTAPA